MKILPVLYEKMYNLTRPKCGECRVPMSCCSPEYCNMSITYAEEKYGIKMQTTDHQSLPLMGENGCTAEPYLRPLCTVHVCEMHYMIDVGFNEKYFSLRDQIQMAEFDEEAGEVHDSEGADR